MKNRYFQHIVAGGMLLASALITQSLAAAPSDNKTYNAITANKNYLSDPVLKHKADSVMKTLSLRQKIAQLIIIEYDANESLKKKKIQNTLVKDEGIGGVIVMNTPLLKAINRVNEFHAMAKTPLLVTIDGEWGVSMRFSEVPVFPRQMQLGALSSDSLVFQVGKAIAQECNKLNIHVNFAPDIDINNNCANPAINTRSFGEDKEKVAKYGIAYSRGMRSNNVAGSAKHFPGHGDTDTDSHKALPLLKFSRARLDSLELYPFRQLIADNVDMVMVGHLEVSSLDPRKKPASISSKVISDLLRNELGYDGIICTDALNMDGVAKMSGYEKAQIPYEAFKAGADILLMPQDVQKAITIIENAVKKGTIKESELNGKVRKVLMLKARCGLFDKGYKPYVSTYNIKERMQSVHNLNLVREISEKTITLLTNKQDILPLKNLCNNEIGIVALGSNEINSMFNNYAQSYVKADSVLLSSKAGITDLEKAKEALKEKEIIIVAFNNTDSRPYRNFGIDTVQFNFITRWALEKPIIAVYMGSPYAYAKIPGAQNFSAFLIGYQSNQANNLAAVESIFGAVPTLGVLPVGTGEFRAGESIVLNKKYRMPYNYYCKAVPTYIDSLQTIDSQKAAMLLTFPLVGSLIDNGNLQELSTLSQLLASQNSNNELQDGENAAQQSKKRKKKNKKSTVQFTLADTLGINGHDNIMVWDLLSQRSGLPEYNGELNMQQVSSLERQNSVEPVISSANLFYLNKILSQFIKDGNLNEIGRESLNKAFKDMEMFNSNISSNNIFTTTYADLAKLDFTINNNGCYAGKQVMGKEEAKLFKTLWHTYLPRIRQ